jgi:hypothetical protein
MAMGVTNRGVAAEVHEHDGELGKPRKQPPPVQWHTQAPVHEAKHGLKLPNAQLPPGAPQLESANPMDGALSKPSNATTLEVPLST